MFQPNLGRWLTMDLIGFAGGDENLYRTVGNNPINRVDPSGLQEQLPFPRLIEDPELLPEPRVVREGQGAPPDHRQLVKTIPAIKVGNVEYVPRGGGEPIFMTSKEHKVMRFPNQKNRTPHGIVVEDTEVRVFGWRRGRGGLLNESGDHVAYVFVEVTFWDPCREKEEVNPVPKRWKLTGFSMQYGVFLRSQHPPALDTESKKMPEIPNETWEEFVDRFISMAQAIKRKQ